MLLLTETLRPIINVLCADDPNLSFHAGLLSLQELHSSLPRGLSSLNKTKHSERKLFPLPAVFATSHMDGQIFAMFCYLTPHPSAPLPSILLSDMPSEMSNFLKTIQIIPKG